MMSTWRSLCAFGVLLLALVLLAPGLAVAQADDTTPAIKPPPVIITVSAKATDFDEVVVTWVTPAIQVDEGPITAFNIYYSTRGFTDSQNAMGPLIVPESATTPKTMATVKGLDANTSYFFRVAVVNDFKIGPLDSVDPTMQASTRTTKAPKPERVTDVRAMAGDKMLMVMWDEPYSGHERAMLDAYKVQYRKSGARGANAGKWMDVDEDDIDVDMMEAVIMELTNGTSYDVHVAAMNDAGGTGDYSMLTEDSGGIPTADGTPTPTPALPVFGAFALGAGLLAAGRARLRRREQRQLMLTR
jgi:hypothetical protein